MVQDVASSRMDAFKINKAAAQKKWVHVRGWYRMVMAEPPAGTRSSRTWPTGQSRQSTVSCSSAVVYGVLCCCWWWSICPTFAAHRHVQGGEMAWHRLQHSTAQHGIQHTMKSTDKLLAQDPSSSATIPNTRHSMRVRHSSWSSPGWDVC